MVTDKEKKLYADRLKKLEGLREAGIDPYPARAQRTHQIGEVIEKFRDLSRANRTITLVGRLRAVRGHGALVFGNLEDTSGRIQLMLKADELGEEKLKTFQQFFDVGDFVQASGTLTKTKRGENSLLVSEYCILAKSLRALPDKWAGLSDVEVRLRKRYLDMLSDPAVREMIEKKNTFWQTIRQFLTERGFLEVQTPVLENIAGGADAKPFKTHYNALNRDFYLRISLEFPLKKLLVGGFEKVFEIGRLFRNEGIDREHLQEYDDMEFYWAYADYNDGMGLVEELFKKVVRAVSGGLRTYRDGQRINWGGTWLREDYFDFIDQKLGTHLENMTDRELKDFAKKYKLKLEKGWGRGRIIDYIWKKLVRPKVTDPMFIINHPIEVSPLAKKNPDISGRVERFQLIAGGTELGNGYSELNDPIDQRERFAEQMKLRRAGDTEAQMMDEDFVEALEYGMPPAVGFGMSERLFSVLMDKSARETVIFPPMREK